MHRMPGGLRPSLLLTFIGLAAGVIASGLPRTGAEPSPPPILPPAAPGPTVSEAPAPATTSKTAGRAVSTMPAASRGTGRGEAAPAGRIIAIDPETGRPGAPSPEQIRDLAPAGSAGAAEPPLRETHRADGAVILHLDGRFQDYAMVRIDKHGRLHHGCVHDDGQLHRTLQNEIPVRVLEEE